MAKKKASKKPATKKAKAKKAPASKASPKKAATKKAAAKKAAPKKKAPTKKKAVKTISAQERYHMIDEAAYYRAEKTGFQVDPHENWIAAEQEIDELLSKQNIEVS